MSRAETNAGVHSTRKLRRSEKYGRSKKYGKGADAVYESLAGSGHLRGPEASDGLLVELPGSFIAHGQQEEAVWCLGQYVHARLTSRAETVC